MKKIRIASLSPGGGWAKKMLLTMKLTIIILFLSLMQVSATVYSQATKFTFDAENKQVVDILREIEENSQFRFFYLREQVDVERRVSVKANGATVEQILDELFKETGVNYELMNDFLIVLKKGDDPFKNSGLSQLYSQQQPAVSGTVIDETGQPLPGVTVLVKGTTQGTVTNANGEYSLTNVPEDATLQFSFVGMLTQEIVVADQTSIDVTLAMDAIGIEEVVAVGYGTQKKENLTAAVEVVDMETLENRPVLTVTEMLQGNIGNLNITTTTSAPGKTSNINIRGFTGRNSTGEPLIIVDGVPQDIDLINPNDVESISVLKDAAASAIYGSRAPNGVIIITTKSGRKNTGMTFSYSNMFRASTPINLPSSLNSYDFVLHNNMAGYNSQAAPEYPEETIQRIRDFIDGKITDNNIIENGKWGFAFTSFANEDYYDIAFRDIVFNHNHDFSLRGGGEKTTYYATVGYKRDQGVYDSPIDKNQTKNLLLKVDTDVNKWLKIGLSTRYTNKDNIRPNVMGRNDNDADFMSLIAFRPNIPNINRAEGYESINTFSILPSLKGDGGQVDRLTNNFIASFYGEITPFDGLEIRGSYSYNTENRQDEVSTFVYEVTEPDGTTSFSRRSANQDQLQKWRHNNIYQTADLVATYQKMFGKHDLTLLAGTQYEINEYDQLYARNTDLYTSSVPSFSTMYGDNQIISDQLFSWSTQGYFARISYNYEGRYLFDFNSRYDATSRYSPDSRWAFFPSFSAGYNIAREEFWPLKEQISMFKLKGSWGRLGNAGTGRPRYIAPLGTGAQLNYILGGARPSYVTMPGIVSDDLTWTKPRTIGFGLEIGALNNRLLFGYDWYQRTIFDEVGVAEQLPVTLGTNPPAKNNAISETRGWEVSAEWRDNAFEVGGDQINYGIKVYLSDYIGYVVEYEDNTTGTRSTWTPGQQFGVVYGYESAGIQTSAQDLQDDILYNNGWFHPGDLLFKDLDGDGRIGSGDGNYWYSEGDRVELGYNYPRYKYGATLSTGWKGFDLRILLDGVGHQVIYSNSKFTTGVTHIGSRGLLDFHGELGYWTLDNQDAYFPRLYTGTKNFNIANDQYMQDLAHLRVKNINLNYTLPKSLIKWQNIDNISVNLSIENAFMIYDKSWSPFDPQFIRYSTYPPSRIFAFGLKVDLN
jgi:TonB-linked SusC/RagA family outer membrane protein